MHRALIFFFKFASNLPNLSLDSRYPFSDAALHGL